MYIIQLSIYAAFDVQKKLFVNNLTCKPKKEVIVHHFSKIVYNSFNDYRRGKCEICIKKKQKQYTNRKQIVTDIVENINW